MGTIKPCIWFQGTAEEAMNYYVSTFRNSKITHIELYEGNQGIPGENELKGKVLTGVFDLNGQEFMCLDGGTPQQCGWITDKFGVTWQITPMALGKMMSDPTATPQQKEALMKTMMPMVKLDIVPLEAAFEGAK